MNSELQHHGILGMHWGIRRYQNYDGTLTKEGKKKLRAQSAEGDSDSSSSTSSSTSNTSSTKTSSELTPEELAARSERRKEIAKKVAIGVGVAAAVAGAAYLGTQAGMKMSEMKNTNLDGAQNLVSNISTTPVAAIASPSANASSGKITNPTTEDIKSFAVKQEAPQANTKAPVVNQEAPKPAADKSHEDYKQAHANTPISELSTQDLNKIVARLNAEKKYSSLTAKEVTSGKKKAANILRGATAALAGATPVAALMTMAKQNPGAANDPTAILRTLGAITGSAATILDLLDKN